MSHTNTTTNFGLPQFITSDKPAWLTDINSAFSSIDTAMKNNQTAASSAQGDATQALSDASDALTAANTADSKGGGAVASISDTFSTTSTYNVGDLVIYNNLLYKCTVAIVTPGAWTGSANWSRTTLEDVINDVKTEVSLLQSGKQDTLTAVDITNQVTLLNDFSPAAWGQLLVLRNANMVMITFIGFKTTTTTSDFTNAIELPFNVNPAWSVARTGDGMVVPIRLISKYMQVGVISSGITCSGQIIGFL